MYNFDQPELGTLLTTNVLDGRRWRTELKNSMRHLCHCHQKRIAAILDWFKQTIRENHFPNIDFKVNYGYNVNRTSST